MISLLLMLDLVMATAECPTCETNIEAVVTLWGPMTFLEECGLLRYQINLISPLLSITMFPLLV